MYIPQVYLAKLIFSVGALIVAAIISFIVKKSIDVVFSRINTVGRTRTLRSLLKNILDIIVFLTVILIILSRWDIDIFPLLTGAGIAGLAISFGAQTLVKDIISGFFIIFENQFSVGDRVKVGDYEGMVEEVTLRLTILRDKNNHLIYIPNSQITTVTKYQEKVKYH